jgi:hypothetical protein
MKLQSIRFEQSGGFAGLIRGCRLDPNELNAQERERLAALVRRSGLSNLAHNERGRADAAGNDSFRYDIELIFDQGRSHYTSDELGVDERIAPLVSYLQSHAQPLPPDREL